MECKYNHDEFCTNDQCPMCGDYCPVPDYVGVCKYEEREDPSYKVSPKSCLFMALLNAGIDPLDNRILDSIWNDFVELMTELGYIQEED